MVLEIPAFVAQIVPEFFGSLGISVVDILFDHGHSQ